MTEADYIIDPENSVPLPTLVRNSFQSLCKCCNCIFQEVYLNSLAMASDYEQDDAKGEESTGCSG